MTPEVSLIAQYGPAFAYLIAAIMVIIFVKKYLFAGTISKEMFDTQLERERDFVIATKEAASHMDEISRQLESITHKQSDAVKEQTDTIRDLLQDVAERLRTLEMVFSDNIDVIRNLAAQCEKHRKNIPDTEVFLQKRKEKQP